MTMLPMVVPFDALGEAALVVDAVYKGGVRGSVADDPLGRLLPVGNQGGFRYAGSPLRGTVRLVVLYTSGAEPDWPDTLDEQKGQFTYFGDNRSHGRELHDTPRRGNALLRDAFAACHGDFAARCHVPPFFLFAKAGTGGRDVRFRGLLAPGGPTLAADDDLQAIWRSTAGMRFQNYRSRFTVLDEGVIPRAWLRDVLAGNALSSNCPSVWREWVQGRSYRPMAAPTTKVVRSRLDQAPRGEVDRQILAELHGYFSSNPYNFEHCAVELWRMVAPATGSVDVTRASRDGGRDAVGVYEIGPPTDRISIDFALEAKCYGPTNSVGVSEMSRLISRIRHRNFGVFVTTSHFNKQAYEEVRLDQHPIVMMCGRDIVDILRSHGYASPDAVRTWLATRFPKDL
ncbi:restriction endonuclease [Micromonospora purpureochromogenes]|uniref:restriction endonuclease n=1 Tax=Micromonospora purpureochromogenes TaxID=47872 RepID=UPI0033F3E714